MYLVDKVSIDTLDQEILAAQCAHECNNCSIRLSCVFCYECSMLEEAQRLEKEVGELEKRWNQRHWKHVTRN